MKKVPAELTAASLALGPQVAVAAQWIEMLRKADAKMPAAEMYRGRAFGMAARAAKLVGADLAIASAGLGLVLSDTLIPSYDLTLSRGGIGQRIEGDFDPEAWWEAVSLGPYGSELSAQLAERPLILACLSATYAPLLINAMLRIPPDALRIFGLGIASKLPPFLRECVLPYDERLETATGPGVRSDFAQRALLHYVSAIRQPGRATLKADRDAVDNFFANTPWPMPMPKRAAADDETIRGVIRRMRPTINNRSAMLRYVRDVEGLACEQGRLSSLFDEVSRE
jgi:hypothetical protein